MLPGLGYCEVGATFDAARVYRYTLIRRWADGPRILWLMLNPSTADEHVLDSTLRRCEGFTRAWGYAAFEVCNLFALRSTDQKVLRVHAAPVGERVGVNDAAILDAVVRANQIIVGWGKEDAPVVAQRAADVKTLLRRTARQVFCLGTNQDRSPKHPLYLSAKTPREAFPPSR